MNQKGFLKVYILNLLMKLDQPIAALILMVKKDSSSTYVFKYLTTLARLQIWRKEIFLCAFVLLK